MPKNLGDLRWTCQPRKKKQHPRNQTGTAFHIERWNLWCRPHFLRGRPLSGGWVEVHQAMQRHEVPTVRPDEARRWIRAEGLRQIGLDLKERNAATLATRRQRRLILRRTLRDSDITVLLNKICANTEGATLWRTWRDFWWLVASVTAFNNRACLPLSERAKNALLEQRVLERIETHLFEALRAAEDLQVASGDDRGSLGRGPYDWGDLAKTLYFNLGPVIERLRYLKDNAHLNHVGKRGKAAESATSQLRGYTIRQLEELLKESCRESAERERIITKVLEIFDLGTAKTRQTVQSVLRVYRSK